MEKVRKLEAEKGRKLTSTEFTAYCDQEMKAYQPKVGRVEDWSRITAATTALLAGQDVTVAAMAATNAVQNNFPLLAFYGVTAASLAYSSYKVYNAYEEGGIQVALNQLGIEVVINAGGAIAGRAVGMVVYKVGSMAYPTVAAALTAVFDKTPGLRMALGKLVDKLVLAGDAIAQSALGRGVAQAEAALGKMELIPFSDNFNELYGRDFLQKQGEKTEHGQSYVRFLKRRLWEKYQRENSLKLFENGIRLARD